MPARRDALTAQFEARLAALSPEERERYEAAQARIRARADAALAAGPRRTKVDTPADDEILPIEAEDLTPEERHLERAIRIHRATLSPREGELLEGVRATLRRRAERALGSDLPEIPLPGTAAERNTLRERFAALSALQPDDRFYRVFDDFADEPAADDFSDLL